MVSKYFWNQRNVAEKKREPFDQWFLNAPQEASMNMRIAPISGEFAMDRIIRYEALEKDINALGIDGLWDLFSSIRAKGNIRPRNKPESSPMYENRAKVVDLIREQCAEEIEHFGYEIPQL